VKLIYPTVFVLIFIGGSLFLLGRSKLSGSHSAPVPAQAVSLENELERDTVPTLYLPPVFKGKPGPKNSWEIIGSADANFVSTKAQLSAWLQNQSWKPVREIQLGTNVNPKVLLTFERDDYEVIFQLSRQSVNQTDFAYRREKKTIIGKGLTK